uniref:Uncharacterized protein n=1 Tax=Opuntia streptacantha TaxID=393608 RepID=A0A7C8YD06_OPUST
MPPRRRKKPPDPTPLYLSITCLFKKTLSILECQLLVPISQLVHLGRIVGLASMSASIPGRFNRPAFNLPCSGFCCPGLGHHSSCQWRFLSIDRSTSVSSVFGSDFACYGCGRTLSPSSVPDIGTSEPRSVKVKPFPTVFEHAIVLMLNGQTYQVRLMAECLKSAIASG